MEVCQIPANHYAHIVDNNTNIIRVEVGPQRYTLSSEEALEQAPKPFVAVPPCHYVKVTHPVKDRYRLPYLNLFDHYEYRYDVEPFPLYPGEQCTSPEEIVVLEAGEGVRVRASEDLRDSSGTHRRAGEEWLLTGPRTLIPQVGIDIVGEAYEETILEGEAIYLTATHDFVDRSNTQRRSGEVWMVSTPGSFFLNLKEKRVKKVKSITLAANQGIHVSATKAFTDSNGVRRRAGDVWSIFAEETESFLPPPEVEVKRHVSKVILKDDEYCYLNDPLDPESRKPRYGTKILKVGPDSFYLEPFESNSAISKRYRLEAEDALLLVAQEAFEDTSDSSSPPIQRKAGVSWMIRGPRSYCPPVEVKVLQKRRSIPLSETEGVYVHDWKTGEIRMEMGVQSFMLQPHEDLWEKHLTEEVELLLKSGGGIGSKDIRKLQYFSDNAMHSSEPRDPTRVVSFKSPGGTAVQVVDMKSKASRVVFGPDLVILRPFEEFTIMRYSAGKPKRSGALVSLCLLLGPDYITDVYEVETLDHARLSVKLAANTHFDFDREDPRQVAKLFSVSDFIGDCAKMIGSQVRSLVARTSLDEFHQNSSALIAEAVFGKDGKTFKFPANNLIITNIDVQHVKVADERARDLLARSVQLAIENTTKTMEMNALNEAKSEEQSSEGRIKLEKFINDAEAERIRHKLIEARLVNEEISKTGSKTAAASAEAEVSKIQGETLVNRAKYKCEALEKINEREEAVLQKKREIEAEMKRKELELELEKEAQLAAIESSRFSSYVAALGPETVKAISEAGNETKIKLLESLGLEGAVVSNGRHPVNLERTANGLVGFM
mmetsp:Transcript_39558/g.62554  ORF Transcript_39558/g.62554 Transcript_39558/m.62554 type:complete len:830 (-) Transcript_39558:66-2555(-)